MANQQTYDAIVIGASSASVTRLCPAFAQAGKLPSSSVSMSGEPV